MPKKILNTSLENWLFRNFSTHTNKELAYELNEKLRVLYEKEEMEILEALEKISTPESRQPLVERLDTIRRFKGIDETYVRHVAKRIGCPPKEAVHISKSNRQKALTKKQNLWKSLAVRVKTPMRWFREFRVRERKYVKVSGQSEIAALRSAICTWNRLEGEDLNIQLKADVDRDIMVVKVQSKPFKTYSHEGS